MILRGADVNIWKMHERRLRSPICNEKTSACFSRERKDDR